MYLRVKEIEEKGVITTWYKNLKETLIYFIPNYKYIIIIYYIKNHD